MKKQHKFQALHALWILAVIALGLSCGSQNKPCDPGETRCSDVAWDYYDVCTTSGEWAEIDTGEWKLCLTDGLHIVCSMACKEGEQITIGSDIWICKIGYRCDDPYYQIKDASK